MIILIGYDNHDGWFIYKENEIYYLCKSNKNPEVINKECLYSIIPEGNYQVIETEFSDFESAFEWVGKETANRYIKEHGRLRTTEELRESILTILSVENIDRIIIDLLELKKENATVGLTNLLRAKNISPEQKIKIEEYLKCQA